MAGSAHICSTHRGVLCTDLPKLVSREGLREIKLFHDQCSVSRDF